MDISNVVALVLGVAGFTISIVSFVLTPYINLRTTKLKKKYEYRLELLNKVIYYSEITHSCSIADEQYKEAIFDVNRLIQLYGYKDELIVFNRFKEQYNRYAKNPNKANGERYQDEMNKFLKLMYNAFRKEIAID